MLKLTPIQRRILAEFSLNSRASISAVARKLGIKEHIARNAFDFLSERLSLRPSCFSDPFRQGLIPYRIFFSLKSGDSARIADMLAYLAALPETIWLFSLHGYYNFGLSIRVASVHQLDILLETFDRRFGDLIQKKTVGTIARFVYFTPWPAYSGRGPRGSFEYRLGDFSCSLDETDRKLIDVVRKTPNASTSELARRLSLSASTVQYRLNHLIDSGVLIAFSYIYDYRVIGTESFLILVGLYGLGGSAHERIIEFAQQHPCGMWASKVIGEWNVELEVVLSDPQELHDIIQQIYEIGGGSVREVLTLVWGKDVKV
jgi:DNA-binding Lrp family transcriptional regulator